MKIGSTAVTINEFWGCESGRQEDYKSPCRKRKEEGTQETLVMARLAKTLDIARRYSSLTKWSLSTAFPWAAFSAAAAIEDAFNACPLRAFSIPASRKAHSPTPLNPTRMSEQFPPLELKATPHPT